MKYFALLLVGICILVFALQAGVGTEHFLLDREVVWQEPWRFVTSIFAHANMGHLLSNIFALALFGLILEARIGSRKFIWLFLVSGVVINVISPYQRSLGASGAIFAVLGVLVVLRPMMRVWVSGMPMPMFVAGIVWLLIDITGVFIPSNVANLAHIFGLVVGVGCGFYWRKQYGDKRKRRYDGPKIDIDAWERKYMVSGR